VLRKAVEEFVQEPITRQAKHGIEAVERELAGNVYSFADSRRVCVRLSGKMGVDHAESARTSDVQLTTGGLQNRRDDILECGRALAL
jgi:hypothetical protein